MKKVLILNRRCIRHPEKGGAEIYTYHLAKALFNSGMEVEWFCCKFKKAPSYEIIEGIKFIRKGNELTTHFLGFMYALKSNPFLIIDEFNGVGFFTFSLTNSILLIHQLYDNFWTAEFGLLGYPLKFIEKLLLKFYREKPVITVSNSTAEDLRRLKFRDIKIISNGLEIEPLSVLPEKDIYLSLVYLGRLKKTKNPEDAIKAFKLIKKHIKEAKLRILGSGPLFNNLRKKYSEQEGLIFYGYVEEDVKETILRKAHFLLVPSIREGWGQVVIQANALGTPAIGYDVAGLKDSIINGITGVLVKNPEDMAIAVIKLWQNREEYQKMAINATKWAKSFSWNKTKSEFLSYLKEKAIL